MSSIPDPFHIVHGIPVPRFVKKHCLDILKENMKLYSDDVWIVTYPKCGTTWTQQMVRLIRNKGVQDEIVLTKAVPWLEATVGDSPGHKLRYLLRPRAFKSHFPYDLMPCGPPHTTPCKYIYVTRNPNDVAVSFFFHSKQGYFKDIEWDSFWRLFINGKMEYGNYFDHLLSWWPHRHDENVLFLTYEGIKADPQGTIRQISTFIEVELTDEIVAKIADLTSFEKMKDDKTANMSWTLALRRDSADKPPFMRKGVVGDWKNFLSEEQSIEMDEICACRLQGTGIEFQYEL